MINFYARNLLLLLLLAGASLFSQTKIIPYQELPTAGGLPTGSGIFFGATMSAASITVNFEGPSDRWIAFGFGTSMYPTDVYIYSNGKSGATHPLGWNDYYNSSSLIGGVNNDATQNWTVISSATVSPGQRTVTASRVLNTGDPNDVVINFASNTLDLVWAKGATPDYTIAYHGTNNRAYGISLQWLSAPTASFVSSTTVCAGSPIVFTNASTGGQTTYTWNFAGGTPATSTSTNPSIIYSTPGTYSVSLVAANAVGSNTFMQINYITVTPTVAPSISIVQTGGTNPMCASVPATFSASVLNGGANPSFQWRINGVNAGSNNPVFNTTALVNSASITCVLMSNATCASPTTFTSAVLSMSVNSTAPATVSTSIVSGNNPMCVGATVVFTATIGNGGSNPSYQWLVNNVNAGTNSPSFTTSTLANGDVVSCVLSSNAPCASSTTAIASGITMTVSSSLVPGISITTNNNPLCAGGIVTISAQPVNAGAAPVYQWNINGMVAGLNNSVFVTNALNNGDIVTCQLTSALQCANPSTVISNALNFTVNPIPATPSISASGPLSICAGQSVTLISSAVLGNAWSNGSTTQSIVASTTASYQVTQILSGCTSSASAVINVTLHPLPTITLSPISIVCKDVPAFSLGFLPTGGTYGGPGILGNLFYPSNANTGSNNIIIYTYTDANNCVDTAAIRIITDECLGILSAVAKNSGVSVFPNPGKGEFTVTSLSEKIKSIRATDASGRCIRSFFFNNVNDGSIDLRNYANGIYTLEVMLETKALRLRVTKIDP